MDIDRTLPISAVLAGALGLVLLFTAALAGAPAPAIAQTTDCTSTIDLMLALDGSESIVAPDFETMKSFAGSLVGHFTVGPDDAHVGIVQFAGEGQGRVEMGLSSDAAAIDAAVAAMAQIVGATDIQEGLASAREQLAVGGRADVPQVVIVLTDGAHNQPGDPVAEAESARGAGMEIVAIAVGPGPDTNQLAAITGAAERVYPVSDFDALLTILDPLVQVVCPPTPTPPREVAADPEPDHYDGGPPGVRSLPPTGSHAVPDRRLQRDLWLLVGALIGLVATGMLLMVAGRRGWKAG